MNMIQKQNSSINEIIYKHTAYHDDKYRIYPSIADLKCIIRDIKYSETTTKYIGFMPFYIISNKRITAQIELEDFEFYLECRDDFSEQDQRDHISEHTFKLPEEMTEEDKATGDVVPKLYEDMDEEEMRMRRILLPLCKYSDVEKYQQILTNYQDYLEELIPYLFERVKKELDLKEEDYPFGYFCFLLTCE